MYSIVVSEHFKRQLKKLVKRDQNLKERVVSVLETFPNITNVSIGGRVFKVRLKRQKSGKSGGYRMYIFVLQTDTILTPLCIYRKSEKENLSSKELEAHLLAVESELNQ